MELSQASSIFSLEKPFSILLILDKIFETFLNVNLLMNFPERVVVKNNFSLTHLKSTFPCLRRIIIYFPQKHLRSSFGLWLS